MPPKHFHAHKDGVAFIKVLKEKLPSYSMSWEWLTEEAEDVDFLLLLPLYEEHFPTLRQTTKDVLMEHGKPSDETAIETAMLKSFALLVGTVAGDEKRFRN